MQIQNIRRDRNASGSAILAGAIANSYATPALADLDPGKSRINLQGLIAGLAMVAAAGNMYRRCIRPIIASISPRESSRSSEPDQGSSN